MKKEEPKQDLLHKCTCLRPQVNCFSGMCSYCNRQIFKNLATEDLKQKQETLEDDFMVWDELFGILAWKFKPTKSGDMFLDAEKVFQELKSKFELKKK